MILLPLNPGTYAGRKFTVRYQTNGYYEIEPSEQGFSMKYVPLEVPVEKSFEDEILGKWLEAPVAFGAFEGEKLIGFVEGSIESWNDRFRISNICVFDPARRHGGLGTALMNRITETAESTGARMIVLETQSCNESAIAFYRKNGFSIIGFDLYSYSNNDPERHEVRIEMGKKLQEPSKGIEHEKSISGCHRFCADPLRGGSILFGRGDWGKGLGRRELRTSPISASDRRLFFPAVQAGKVSWPR